MTDVLVRLIEHGTPAHLVAEVAMELARARTAQPDWELGSYERRFYVYEHYGKTTGEVFYVGKGSGSRCDSFHGRNGFWRSRVKDEGGFFSIILRDELTEQDALKMEAELIKLRWDEVELTNIVGVPYEY